jgi:HPt (histidine-containing phosphotransfer) domain-containing protein
MTANVFDKDRLACLAAGMDDFIPKPLEFRQTLGAIAYWLQRAHTPAEPPARTTAPDATPPPTAPAFDVPIDFEAYVERMGGNREIAEIIIRGFLEEIPKQLRNIEAAIESGDIKTVDREAHSMKGGGLNVFANGVMEAAKALEMHAKSGSLDNARELLEEIKKQYERLRDCDLDFTGGKKPQ